jgi:serine/alanine adding enzyme
VAARALLAHALQLLGKHGADYVELRQCEPPPPGGDVHLAKVGMRLDLSVGTEKVWQSFPAKVRNQVRKAEKAGLKAHVEGENLIDEFYSVLAVNMRDLGSPVHHREFFIQMFAELGSQARLVIVRDGVRVVAGLVCLFFRDTVTVPWASSLREYLAKCPNNLAYWEAMQFACAQGFRCFDFGRSSIDSGTYYFKRQWGAQPIQIYWQIVSATGEARAPLSADNPKYQLALEIWKSLPVSLATLVGPRLRKYITN